MQEMRESLLTGRCFSNIVALIGKVPLVGDPIIRGSFIRVYPSLEIPSESRRTTTLLIFLHNMLPIGALLYKGTTRSPFPTCRYRERLVLHPFTFLSHESDHLSRGRPLRFRGSLSSNPVAVILFAMKEQLGRLMNWEGNYWLRFDQVVLFSEAYLTHAHRT